MVVTKLYVTKLSGYQIVGYQIVGYQIVSYQFGSYQCPARQNYPMFNDPIVDCVHYIFVCKQTSQLRFPPTNNFKCVSRVLCLYLVQTDKYIRFNLNNLFKHLLRKRIPLLKILLCTHFYYISLDLLKVIY